MGKVSDPLRERILRLDELGYRESNPMLIQMLEACANEIDRELERRMREQYAQQYARGYEDGRRSMDAEHYAVALKLQDLEFDGGSHENLSKIAYAIYPCATGWTCESSKGLRDELVRLMGGVHDEHLPNICRTSSEPDENGEFCEIEPRNTVESSKYAENYKSGHITDELREWASENTIKDMVLTTYPEQHGVHGILEQLIAIADRIDKQFERICEQQETVLQSTIDEMTEFRERDAAYALTERERLQRRIDVLTAKMELDYVPRIKLDEAMRDAEMWRNRSEDMRMERDELQKKLEEYERRDTPEAILRDMHLGNVTDSEAVKRIRALYG